MAFLPLGTEAETWMSFVDEVRAFFILDYITKSHICAQGTPSNPSVLHLLGHSCPQQHRRVMPAPGPLLALVKNKKKVIITLKNEQVLRSLPGAFFGANFPIFVAFSSILHLQMFINISYSADTLCKKPSTIKDLAMN